MAELYTLGLKNDANLKAYYRLNDLNDSGPNNVVLTNNSGVSFNTVKYGLGADVGSGNSTKYLSTTNTLGIDGGAISIAMWLRVNVEIASSVWVVANQVSNTSKVEFFIKYDFNAGTRRVIFGRNKIGSTETDIIFTGALGAGSMNHLVLVYDGVNLNGYLNNTAGTPSAASGSGTVTATAGFFILAGGGGGGPSAAAMADDVSVFNRLLTAGEVNQLYQQSVNLYRPSLRPAIFKPGIAR